MHNNIELSRLTVRKLSASFYFVLITLSAIIGVSILAVIVIHIFINGVGALNVDFFTKIPKPFGEVGGGVAPAILGTLTMLVVAALIAIPIGVMTAIFVVEYGEKT